MYSFKLFSNDAGAMNNFPLQVTVPVLKFQTCPTQFHMGFNSGISNSGIYRFGEIIYPSYFEPPLFVGDFVQGSNKYYRDVIRCFIPLKTEADLYPFFPLICLVVGITRLTVPGASGSNGNSPACFNHTCMIISTLLFCNVRNGHCLIVKFTTGCRPQWADFAIRIESGQCGFVA